MCLIDIEHSGLIETPVNTGVFGRQVLIAGAKNSQTNLTGLFLSQWKGGSDTGDGYTGGYLG